MENDEPNQEKLLKEFNNKYNSNLNLSQIEINLFSSNLSDKGLYELVSIN